MTAAQTVSWKGPVSGLIYDAPSRSLRPLVGFPGASYLGGAILTGIESGFISPDGDSALVMEEGRPLLITALRGGDPRRWPLPEAVDRLDRVAWAYNSRAAVVCSFSARRVWRIEAGDSGPSAGEAIDLSFLKGEFVSLATNEDASRTVVGVRDPDEGGLYAVGEGVVSKLFSLNPGPIVFSRTGGAFYAVDADTQEILKFSDLDSGGWERLTFAGEESPLTELRGIAISRDGRSLYVAGASDRVVRVYDLSSRSLLSAISLSVAPDRLAELAGTSSVFLLASREKSGQPIWILDARVAPSVFFVPAGE